jgi:predicted alpha/beta-fold hydrolase
MSLAFPNFEPHPLIRGGHLQTIIGSYLPWLTVDYRAKQHRVPLADGDAIVVHDDLPPAREDRKEDRRQRTEDSSSSVLCPLSSVASSPPPVVLLLHGLGGCHQSGYMQRCAVKLTERGYRVFRMDLRGYGAGVPLARHPVHAGRSEDAAAVLDFIIDLCPDSPVHIVGFSMGANIVLKLAGELGPLAPANLASVMAVAPPIDLIECSRNMQRRVNRIYDRTFVKSLVAHIARRRQVVPDALHKPLDPPPRRLLDFDNRFTAPLSGFADAEDYYVRASSGALLKHIVVPTLILTAANDPIVPVKPFETASYSPTTKLHITPCGGHLGFIARRGRDPDRRWLDWRVIEWVESQNRGSRPAPLHTSLPASRESASAELKTSQV